MEKLIWSYNSNSVCLLIPKKRGAGYLRVPLGHHHNELSLWIDDNIRHNNHPIVTVTGLDGYLRLDTGWITKEDAETQIAKPISEYYAVSCIFKPYVEFLDLVLSNFQH